MKRVTVTVILFLLVFFLWPYPSTAANYFVDNFCTNDGNGGPPPWCVFTRRAGPWNSLVGGMESGMGVNPTLYVRGNTGIPYKVDPWGFLNPEDGPYSNTTNAIVYGNWTGTGIALGPSKSVISGLQNETGWVIISGTKYTITDASLYAGLYITSGYYGPALPVGTRGVWVNGISLTYVATSGAVVPGTYNFDGTSVLIFDAGVVPVTVQATYLIEGLELNVGAITSGFIFEYARRGAGNGLCGGWTVQNCQFTYNLMDGLSPSENGTIIGCESDHNNVGFNSNTQQPFTGVVHHSLIHDNLAGGILQQTWASTGTFYNNTISNNGGYGISLLKPSSGTLSEIFENNIVSGNTTGQVNAQNDPAVILTIANFNDVYGTTAYSGKWVQGTNDILTNPQFANPSVFNFTPVPSSPVINKGTWVGLFYDSIGNPILGVPDIGAYEYQGSMLALPVKK